MSIPDADDDNASLLRALRETEVQYAALFQSIQDGIVISDMAGNLLLINDAEAAINGYASVAEMKVNFAKFAEVYEFFSSDGQLVPFDEWPLTRILRGETISDLNLHARRRDTGQAWVFCFSGPPVRDPQGRQVLAVVVTRDITALTQSEEARERLLVEVQRNVEEAEDERSRLHAVLETLPIGLMIVDAQNNIREANAQVTRVYSGDAPLTQPLQQYRLGKAWWVATGQPVEADMWPSMQALRLGTAVTGQEIEILRADGSRVIVLDGAAPLHDVEGRITGAVVVVQDITEFKQNERELRQLTASLEQRVQERTVELSEALEREQAAHAEAESNRFRYQSLLEAAPDGIVIVDAAGRITLVNTQTERMTGYAREELIGRQVETLLPARYGEIHLQHRADYMTEPRTRPMGIGLDLYLKRKDGSEMPVEISLSPLYVSSGILVTASIRDITARKSADAEIRGLNDALQRHVEQLKNTNQELEAFSYSVSHDLRAPLRSIDGFSKILVERYPEQLDARGRDYLERVRAAAQRMNQLIEDMLNLSRVSRAEMRHDVVNLSTLAADILASLQQQEPERTVVVTIMPDLLVTGDKALLQIVLDNLLRNAWKFTSKRDVARVSVGMMEQEGERVYYVRDNGAGFDMAYINKLFTPFQRLHSEEEFPGTGIGLALVQRIIRRHGGRIWAEGSEGYGATFCFTLGGEPQ